MTATDLVLPVLGGAPVLVADGDPDGSATTTAVLRLNGFDAREARTAEDLLHAVSDAHPSVLVMDLDLPDTDGIALIRRVRSLPTPPTVVVVTAHTALGTRLAAMQAGATAFLLKPVEPVDLAQLVGKLCDERS